jgi:hypothetical protein
MTRRKKETLLQESTSGVDQKEKEDPSPGIYKRG